MSIADQFPRRMSRAVLAAVVPPGSTAEDGTAGEPGAAPGSWPWRRAALLASIAAQLITISALESADPVPASWPALLLAVVLVTGIIGQAIQTGLFYLFFLPALATMIVAALRLRREGA